LNAETAKWKIITHKIAKKILKMIKKKND
jgi:hypothetical protein